MRRIAPSKKRLEQVVTDLKSNYFQNARPADVFLNQSLLPDQANQFLHALREKNATSPKVYDNYLRYFAARGDLDSLQKGFTLAHQDGHTINDTSSFIICAHASAGSLARARDLLRECVARGDAPRPVRVYNLIIRLLCAQGKMAEAEEVLTWGTKYSSPNAVTYFPVIAYARKKLDSVNALRLYSQMKYHKVQPDMYIFCELLNLFSHDDPRIPKLFADMRASGVRPNTVAHNIVIASEGRAGDVEAVRRRIEGMRSQDIPPDAMTYLALVHAYKVRKDAAGAASVLDEMANVGVAPEVVTYALVARTMFSEGDEKGVRSILRRMDAQGLNADTRFFAGLTDARGTQPQWIREEMTQRNIARDQRMFDAQIRINGTDTKAIVRLYAEMRANKILPSDQLVSFIFHKLKMESRARDCKEILLELEDAGAKPALKLYNMVLGLLSRAGDPDSCAEVLARMKRSSHAHPDEHSYHSLALGFGQAGMSHLSVRTLRQAQAEGFASPGLIGSVVGALGGLHNNINSNVNSTININNIELENINGESGKGINSKEVEELMTEMCKNGIVTTRAFNDAIKFSMKDLDSSMRLYRMMGENNIAPDTFTYSLLIRTAMRNNDIDLAFSLSSQMQDAGIPFDDYTYNSLISISAKRGNFDICEQMLARMHTNGVNFAPDEKSYHTLIIELVRGKVCETERALRLINTMVHHRIAPDADTTHWVLKSLFNSGALTQAWDLIAKMRSTLGHIHNHAHNQMMWEYMWRGACHQCEELLDRAETVKPSLTTYDFNHALANVATRGGGDACAAAYVFSRMIDMSIQPTKETFLHLKQIYGSEFGWKEGEEKTNEDVINGTKELLAMIPEMFAVPKSERIARRERKEKLMQVPPTNNNDPSSFIFDNEEEDYWRVSESNETTHKIS